MGSPGSEPSTEAANRDHPAGGDNVANSPIGPVIRIKIGDVIVTIRT
ncbi:MAG: hypothetical protein FWG96_03675 [Methanomassiliicoccaceae archaeon]|nr:hypothetical protein [Methanomassiliicoccaceae archaeon]